MGTKGIKIVEEFHSFCLTLLHACTNNELKETCLWNLICLCFAGCYADGMPDTHTKTSLVLITWEVFRTTIDGDLVLFICDYLLNTHKMGSNSITSWTFQMNKCELKPNAFSRKKKKKKVILLLDLFLYFLISGMHCFLDCL